MAREIEHGTRAAFSSVDDSNGFVNRRSPVQSWAPAPSSSRLKGPYNLIPGEGNTKERRAWRGMKSRCHSQVNGSWKYYGGRGISVCDRWRASYLDFLADVGRAPSWEHQLDRIDNDGNYEPGNVRWATRSQQAHNKRHGMQQSTKDFIASLPPVPRP